MAPAQHLRAPCRRPWRCDRKLWAFVASIIILALIVAAVGGGCLALSRHLQWRIDISSASSSLSVDGSVPALSRATDGPAPCFRIMQSLRQWRRRSARRPGRGEAGGASSERGIECVWLCNKCASIQAGRKPNVRLFKQCFAKETNEASEEKHAHEKGKTKFDLNLLYGETVGSLK